MSERQRGIRVMKQPEQHLNPEAYEYRLDVLVQHRAKGTEDDFQTFGLALTPDGRECLGESIDDLNSMLSTGVFEVVDGPLAGHCGNCYTALPAELDTVRSVEELEALSVGSIIRSVHLGIVRERLETGWLAVGGDAIKSSRDLCELGTEIVVLYRQGV